MTDKFGYITQVIGPVVDVIFEGEGNELPPIYAALKIERDKIPCDVWLWIQQMV